MGGTLTSPTPSGEPVAYIVQTDPFFAKLRPWGDAIYDLWEHNHGLDGSGVQVPGIVPVLMTEAEVYPAPVGSPPVVINNEQPIHPHHDGSPEAVNGLNDIIPVAVLTTSIAAGDASDFDASQIDPAVVRFGPGSAEDVDLAATIFDQDGDGDADAVFEFLTGDAGFSCTDIAGEIRGATLAGDPFVSVGSMTGNCDAQCHN